MIKPAFSESASPVNCAVMLDGALCFFVDHCKVNALTLWNMYHLPSMENYADPVGWLEVLCTLNAGQGYWKIPLHDESQSKTTFTSPADTYRFTQKPFGLMNSPAIPYRTLNVVQNCYTGRACLFHCTIK